MISSQNNPSNPYQPLPNHSDDPEPPSNQQRYPPLDPPQNPPPQNIPQYPQYSQYPQYLSQQFYAQNMGQAGYPQRYGYGNEPAGLDYPQGQMILEIQEIECAMDRGWYRCYLVWLYILTAFAALEFLRSIVFMALFGQMFNYVSSFVISGWVVAQSVMEILAINKKSLVLANRALLAMAVFALMLLVLFILTTVWYNKLVSTFNLNMNTFSMQAYMLALVWLYGFLLVIHLLFSVSGAINVRSKLAKRRELLDALH